MSRWEAAPRPSRAGRGGRARRRRASTRGASRRMSRRAFDLRAQSPQTGVEVLEAAVDLLDVADDALARRAKRRGEKRHTRADVGTAKLSGAQLRRTHHHGT